MPALLTTTCRSPKVSIGGVDQALRALPRRHAVAVGDGLAAHALDLVDHLLGRAEVAARAVDVAAEVVDDDLGAVGGQAERVLAPDAAAGAGHDGDTSFTQLAHVILRHAGPSGIGVIISCRRFAAAS